MTPARAQLEALEPLVVKATFQLVEDLQAEAGHLGLTTHPATAHLDEKSALFSIAISLRRIADHLTRLHLADIDHTLNDVLLHLKSQQP